VAKHDLEWNDHRVQMIDLQYHDIRPARASTTSSRSRTPLTACARRRDLEGHLRSAKDTRAYFRGMCLQRYSDEIVSASWDSVIFDLKEGPLKKIFMLDRSAHRAHVRQLLTESPTAADLLRNISRPSFGM